MPTYLAVDLGAESGRVVRGTVRDGRLTIEQIRRFENRPRVESDGLHWDVRALYAEACAGLAAATSTVDRPMRSVGIDTWGNDFALLDADGRLVCEPWHYRDRRTAGAVERLTARTGTGALYRSTGTPPLPITTAAQLVAMDGSPLLERAERLALMPDLFGYWLTGVQASEQTIASTSQLFDVSTRTWADEVIGRLGLPRRLFVDPVRRPGSPVGPVTRVAELAGVALVAVAGHDTASAVAAIPAAATQPFGYISCGTWSLVGLELSAPVLTEEALAAGFSNEAGVAGTTRFLRNGTGLWLLQRCREAWRGDGGAPSYAELIAAAGGAPTFRSLVDPDAPELAGFVDDMPAAIATRCRSSAQPVPADRAAVARCILDSLACRYRWVLERAETLAGQRVAVVHLVGGGAANRDLCQLTADLTGRPVLAGPVEATAVGNLLVQAWADGELGSLAELRALVRRSMPPVVYEPRAPARAPAEDAYHRFLGVLQKSASRPDETN